MAIPTLTGPSLAPVSGGPAKQLVVLLHGVGANGDDLIDLAPYFARRLPDAAFISPNAPFEFDMAPFGRQWFSLQDRSPPNRLAGVRLAAPILNAFLDAQLAKHGLTDADLALIGFSQGTMVALHLALRRPHPCAALLGYSGMLVAPELLPAELTVRPKVLLVHGEDDEMVPPSSLPAAVGALEEAGISVSSLSCPGLGHSISDEGLIAGIAFVAQAFGL